jgi:hypothetical protein
MFLAGVKPFTSSIFRHWEAAWGMCHWYGLCYAFAVTTDCTNYTIGYSLNCLQTALTIPMITYLRFAKPLNTLCGQNAESIIKAGGTYSHHWALTVTAEFWPYIVRFLKKVKTEKRDAAKLQKPYQLELLTQNQRKLFIMTVFHTPCSSSN